MRKILLACAIIISGCTNARHLSDNDDAWIAKQKNVLGVITTEVMYCRAHKEKDGKGVDPICYRASERRRYEGPANEK